MIKRIEITRANGFKSTGCFNNITDNYIMQLYRIKSDFVYVGLVMNLQHPNKFIYAALVTLTLIIVFDIERQLFG